ncbi:MAG: hypothetical protein AAB436_04260 [Patescibacteria group bacterium]
MRDILLFLSGLLTIVCVIPYCIDIVKRQTKPRIVSWFNWTLLTGIATAAAIADKQWPSVVLTGSATAATMMIVILGIKYGDTKIEPLDVVCQIGAVIGLVLWLVFNSPLIAIIMSVGIDFLVGLPTYKHAYKKPHEETKLTFIIAFVAALLALLAIDDPQASGLIFPIYLSLANLLIISILQFSPNIVSAKPKAKAQA